MTAQRAQPASVLIFAPSAHGGIAEHVHYQASELCRRGIAVTMLCSPQFVKPQAATAYRQDRRLIAPGDWRLGGRLGFLWGVVANNWLLAGAVAQLRPDLVLMEAFTEYFAPLWVWPHLLFARLGTAYVANLHDPLRERRFGPAWFHKLSIRLGYAPLRGGLIHGDPPAGADIPDRLAVRLAPVGIYEDYAAMPVTRAVRAELGIGPAAFVLLAFGHVGDRKNIDLLIAALAEVPEAWLLVVGNVTARRDRPVAFYRDLAARLGVAERVRFVVDYVPDEDVPAYFAAADAVALTYSAGFVSQSGVLQIAANWDKPILASSGEGPLREAIEQHRLGVFVQPDSGPAVVEGLRRIMADRGGTAADCSRYRETANWRVNIDRMLEVAA
jgi:glycosyltransferase involved in cell wall biosynthesis